MAFKPMNSGNNGGNSGDYEPRNFPVPKAGSRPARVSLIIDLGIQEREGLWKVGDKIVEEGTDGAEFHEQKPCQQVAVFADLVKDIVDYGGDIGEAQYRLMLNKSFQGVVQGINFVKTPPKDAKGKLIEGKPWGLHPASLLTKLAKAVGREDVIVEEGEYGMDISQLLNLPFMAQVEVKVTQDKNGKKDSEGNVIEYKNVNYKGAAPVPTVDDEDGNEKPMAIAKLQQKARCITFDEATVEDIKFIRGNLLKMIKNANNYAGSAMQKAVEAFEAQRKAENASEGDEPEEKPAEKKQAAKKTAPMKKQPVQPNFDDMDDDIPF